MNLLVSILLSDILPIFVIAGAGYLLARYADVTAQSISRVVFYSTMPCLAFRMLLTSTATGPNVGRIIVIGTLIMGGMGVVGYGAGRVMGLAGPALRAFVMVVMFSNGGNYGLPVVRFAFGADALTYATIFFLTGAVLTYIFGAFFASSHHHRLIGALEKIWKMPALYGMALALLLRSTGQTMPEGLLRPIEMLSDAALPMMILVLGMQLQRAAMPKHPGRVLWAVGISLLVAPLVALGLCAMFGLTGTARQAVVILSSMPVAVVTTILALEYELEPDFVTGAVFVSTLASPLTLVPLIAYLQ